MIHDLEKLSVFSGSSWLVIIFCTEEDIVTEPILESTIQESFFLCQVCGDVCSCVVLNVEAVDAGFQKGQSAILQYLRFFCMWRFLWVCVHRLNRRFLGPPILGLNAAPMEHFWVRSGIHGPCGGVGHLFQQAIGFQPRSPGLESCRQWVIDGGGLWQLMESGFPPCCLVLHCTQ